MGRINWENYGWIFVGNFTIKFYFKINKMYNNDTHIMMQIEPIKIAMRGISEQIKLSLNEKEVTEETIISFKKEYLLLSQKWRKIIDSLIFT